MARPKLGEGRTERLQLVITDKEVEAIERWQANHQVRTRSEAIRRLCQVGLSADQHLESVLAQSREVSDKAAELVDKALGEDRPTIDTPDRFNLHHLEVVKGVVDLLAVSNALSAKLANIEDKSSSMRQPGKVEQLLEKSNEKFEQVEAKLKRLLRGYQ